MSMSNCLYEFLDDAGVDFELMPHDYTPTSRRAAEAAHVPPAQFAKSVLLEDERGYVMAVVPANRRVDLPRVQATLGRPLVLAREDELSQVFEDCERGALPALGQAFGVDVVWDDGLSGCPDVYFEAGDHTEVVHVSGPDFRSLMGRSPHAAISCPA